MSSRDRIIVSVLGKDKVGLIAPVTAVLAEHGVNILDISQTILQEFLAMIIIADIAGADVDLPTLKKQLDAKGAELGVRIGAQHEDVFLYMHRI